jgi:hypothetical protein
MCVPASACLAFRNRIAFRAPGGGSLACSLRRFASSEGSLTRSSRRHYVGEQPISETFERDESPKSRGGLQNAWPAWQSDPKSRWRLGHRADPELNGLVCERRQQTKARRGRLSKSEQFHWGVLTGVSRGCSRKRAGVSVRQARHPAGASWG